MKAGRELDALVAEKVMGEAHNDVYWHITPTETRIAANIPAYSTQMRCTWQVVEKLRALNIGIALDVYPDGKADCWTLENLDEKDADHSEHTNNTGLVDTAPLAICLAALAAVGVQP